MTTVTDSVAAWVNQHHHGIGEPIGENCASRSKFRKELTGESSAAGDAPR